MSNFYMKNTNELSLHELMMEDIVPDYKPDIRMPNKIASQSNAIVQQQQPQIVESKPITINLPKGKEFIEQYVMLDSYVKVKNCKQFKNEATAAGQRFFL